jgi:hypothetical protein
MSVAARAKIILYVLENFKGGLEFAGYRDGKASVLTHGALVRSLLAEVGTI